MRLEIDKLEAYHHKRISGGKDLCGPLLDHGRKEQPDVSGIQIPVWQIFDPKQHGWVYYGVAPSGSGAPPGTPTPVPGPGGTVTPPRGGPGGGGGGGRKPKKPTKGPIVWEDPASSDPAPAPEPPPAGPAGTGVKITPTSYDGKGPKGNNPPPEYEPKPEGGWSWENGGGFVPLSFMLAREEGLATYPAIEQMSAAQAEPVDEKDFNPAAGRFKVNEPDFSRDTYGHGGWFKNAAFDQYEWTPGGSRVSSPRLPGLQWNVNAVRPIATPSPRIPGSGRISIDDEDRFDLEDIPADGSHSWDDTTMEGERTTNDDFQLIPTTYDCLKELYDATNTLSSRVQTLDTRSRAHHNRTYEDTMAGGAATTTYTTPLAYSSQPGIQVTSGTVGWGAAFDVHSPVANANGTYSFTIDSSAVAPGAGGTMIIDVKGSVADATNID